MMEGMGQPEKRILTGQNWGRDEKFRNLQKRSLTYKGSVTLSKHIAHYDPCSGFSYYSLLIPTIGLPLSATWERTG